MLVPPCDSAMCHLSSLFTPHFPCFVAPDPDPALVIVQSGLVVPLPTHPPHLTFFCGPSFLHSFQADKGFKGAEISAGPRSGPVEFERNAPPADEADPFGLDAFMSDVKKVCMV